jgi:hypothetical protein
MIVVRLKALGVVVVGLALLAGWGCSGRPSRVHPPSIDASAAGKAAMEQYDTNKDGKVAGEELLKAPSLRDAIARLDTNKDGGVSAEEVTAMIEKWQEMKIGLMSLSCRVNYKGRPLAGANVVFEPEKFLGENVKVCQGTTDQTGMVSMKIPGSDLPGVAPGLYLVKITSAQVKLSPAYNDQTVLGLEVSNLAKNIEQGIVFDVK